MSVDDQALPPAVVRQAIAWMLKLREQRHERLLLEQCARWRSAHPSHELAWQRVTGLGQEVDLSTLPGAPMALHVLEPARARLHRRQALKLLGGVALLGSVGWLGKDLEALDDWRADYASALGEHRRFTLPDGSLLQLDTCSAVNLAFDARHRALALVHGQLMLSCSPDRTDQRPMRISTREASVQGLDGRVVVRQQAQSTSVSVLEGQATLHSHHPDGTSVMARAGQSYRLDAQGIHRLDELPLQAGAWAQGLIVTRGMRLQEFLAEVSRYRRGYLGCSAAVADWRLSGVYRLEDTDRLLAILPQSLPVKLERRTRWWVRVEQAG
ncbi:FecR family protein [Pseudomonas entomophila]|nr:FecR family protein [Pseudomonas entomophila]